MYTIIMKAIIISFIFLIPTALFSQLTADAGGYKAYCISWLPADTLILGGNPTAQGGVPPYTYLWETSYTYNIGSFSWTYHASDFLIDTTVANPLLINYPIEEDITFTLTITDALGNQVSDYAFVRPSIFVQHLGNIHYYLEYGDSVFHTFGHNIGGGTPPYQDVFWQSSLGLPDSTQENNFWIYAESTQQYFITLTDAVSCTVYAAPMIYLYTGYADLNESPISDANLIFPNPTNSTFTLANPELIEQVEIIDTQGKKLAVFKVLPIEVSEYQNGSYWIIIWAKDGSKRVEQLVLNR